jgi:hypothetical protein
MERPEKGFLMPKELFDMKRPKRPNLHTLILEAACVIVLVIELLKFIKFIAS